MTIQRLAARIAARMEFDRSVTSGQFVKNGPPTSPRDMQNAYHSPGVGGGPSAAAPKKTPLWWQGLTASGRGPSERDIAAAAGTAPQKKYPALFPAAKAETENVAETVKRFIVQRAKGIK